MYIITVSGFSLWLCYGLLLAQWPLILTNGVCLLLSAFILTMKLAPPKYRDKIAMLVTRTRRRSAERR